MKIVFLIQGSGPTVFLRQAYEELPETEQKILQMQFLDTDELDRQEEVESYDAYFDFPDFYYLDIHAGLPYFKKFDRFWKEIKKKKPVFIHTGIQDENLCMR